MTEDKGILIRNIYYMLSYAFQELRQNKYVEIEGETFDNIYDLFAEIMAVGISSQLKQGLYREYVAKSESIQTIKGKININGTIANRMRNNWQVVCDYDELSENNILNQIIKSTVMLLMRQGSVKQEIKLAFRKEMLFFANVEEIDISAVKWQSIRFYRSVLQNNR